MSIQAKSGSSEQSGIRLTLVVTLRNGVQIRAGVKDVTVRHQRGTGKLAGIEWTLDDDPFGNSITWIDYSEVVAVHYEREPS